MKNLIKNNHWLVLGLIIIIAIILRFYQLGSVPVSPDWDEASIGYNAYSILLTGHDEYGKFLPVVIESFGDYKPALYVYLSIPSVAVFGLNTFAVRLPAAIFGVLAVLATYFLVFELFKKNSIALLSALFLAISPWNLQFSRVGFEAGVGDAFVIFIALFFLKGLKKPVYLFLAVVLAALNLYTYQSEKVFTPMLVLLLIIIYHRQLLSLSKKILISTLILGFMVALPIVIFTFSNQRALERLSATNIFTASADYQAANWLMSLTPQENLADLKNHDISGMILDNRKVILAEQIISNYVIHFNPNWLFMPDLSAPRHHAPQMGLLYIWDGIFLLIGIYILIFSKFDPKVKALIFGWFLLTPVPASITIDVPHAVRTLNFLPTFQIFIALGLVSVLIWCKNKYSSRISSVVAIFFALLLLANIAFYLDSYFVQYNYYNSQDWQYGYTQLIPYLQQHKSEYKKIIVSNYVPLDQSYIFFLFYLRFPPVQYQKIAQAAGGHYTNEHKFAGIEFRQINMRELKQPEPGSLYVIGASQVVNSKKVIKTIYFLNGTPAISLVKG